MLKKCRIAVAVAFFALITLLFCDFTGAFSERLAPLAKIQFLPAVWAGALAVVAALLIAALLFGRLYCSTICPLGIYQDAVSRLAARRKKNRFGWRPGKTAWRVFFVALYAGLALGGFGTAASLLDPYGTFGRIASNLLAPIYRGGNNLLAYFAERAGSFAFYTTEAGTLAASTCAVAVVTLAVVTFFAWRHGRLYCNTVCPVGAILGLFASFALFRPRIDVSKCNRCGKCAKNCKASCIDPETRLVDSSRCVVCFDCLENCPQKAFSYSPCGKNRAESAAEPDSANSQPPVSSGLNSEKSSETPKAVSTARRGFFSAAAMFLWANAAPAQEPKPKKKKLFDGGLAPLVPRVSPVRTVSPLPAGSGSVRDFSRRCTACQLCVSVCPNRVLRPSGDWKTMMRPEMSFERGYCRPECVRCSEVCPAGAILPTTEAEKSATQIGYAVWVRDACIVVTDEVECGNCERHCPTDAIEMIPLNPDDEKSRKIPTVNVERCIGCGACEHLCPARPTSAIYVEGVDRQRTV